MDREAIAKAIYKLNPEIQPWDGDPFSFEEAKAHANSYYAKLAYEQADEVIELLAR